MKKLFKALVDRVWVPIAEAGNLVEAGFAPEGLQWEDQEIFTDDNKCRPLSHYAEARCLVLLGDPGLGKTTALDAAYRSAEAAGEIVSFLDLSTIETTHEIRAAIPSSAVDRVTLFLDSLDEGRLSIKQLFNKLVPLFDGLPSDLQSTLRLRLTCRSVEWTGKIDGDLKSFFGEENVIVLQLAPLRRKDVRNLLLTEEGIDVDGFFEEVNRTHAEALAARPITLRFLLNEFRKEGKFPTRVSDLYAKGMEFLASEHSDSRRSLAETSALSSSERIAIAERLACLTILTNHLQISLNDIVETGNAVGLSDLAREQVPVGDALLSVTKPALEEVLRSALFTSMPSNCVQWAHKDFAEYLAAKCLGHSGLGADEQHSLLTNSTDPSGEVVPQLSGVAVWLASLQFSYLNKLAECDPQLVLRADLVEADPRARCSIVESYLSGLASGKLHDRDFGIWSHYWKLNHPSLADQLRRTIADGNLHIIARRAAIDIAEATKQEALIDDLVHIALNEDESRYIRKEALSALLPMNNPSVARRVLPLTNLGEDSDPDDEIRGAALSLAWPSVQSTSQMLDVLGSARQENLIGSYRRFIWEIPRVIPADDLEVALHWMRSKVESTARGERVDRDFEELAGGLVGRAAQEVDADPSLMEPLADLVTVLITNSSWHDWKSRGERRGFTEFGGHKVRQKLAAAVLKRLGEKEAIWVIHEGLLLRNEDLAFVFSSLENASSDEEIEPWDTVAWVLHDATIPSEFQQYYSAAIKHPVLRERLASRLGPIDIDGEAARRHKETHRRMRKGVPKREKPTVEAVDEWIGEALRSVVSDDGVDSWWVCFSKRWLTFNPEQGEQESVDIFDLPALPGYLRADEDRRLLFLEAAKKYVTDAPTDIESWWHTPNEFGWRSLAALGALLLLEEVDATFLEDLSREIWAKWLPILIAEEPNYEEAKRRRLAIYERAQANAPDLVVRFVRERIRTLLAPPTGGGGISFGALMPKEWSKPLVEVAKVALQDTHLSPESLKSGIVELAKRDREVANTLCDDAFQKRHCGEVEQRRAAACIAGLLEATDGKSWSDYAEAVLADRNLLKATLCATG